MNKKLTYELEAEVVNYLLQVLDNTQIRGVQQAETLLKVKDLLQNPLNKEDLEKEQYEELKNKFEKSKS